MKNLLSFLIFSFQSVKSFSGNASAQSAGQLFINTKTIPFMKSHFKIKKCPYRSLLTYPINKFSTFSQPQSVFSKQTEPQMFKLEQDYKKNQKLCIFEHVINRSMGLNDQMIVFKIFKVMQNSPFDKKAYENLFTTLNNISKKKSDNTLLLLASIKKTMARHQKNQRNYAAAIDYLQEALDILEYSMVPPLFPYYSIYREYGLLHDIIGETKKAKQALTQTVQILDDFVNNSDDSVSTNDFCKNMAASYNCLAKIDPQNRNKWMKKAEEAWKEFTQNKYNQVQYAKTVVLNINKLLKEDKEKGQGYYHFNLYKFENKELKDMLQKAREQALI